jgi:hypothetical protein
MPNAMHHDAEIVLKLYDLRREEVMRKAREWMVGDFWPTSADDVLKIANSGFKKSAYYRQVISFCEMACSLPLHGAVHTELFANWCGEIIFIFAKFKPYLAEIRQKTNNPGFLGNTEKFMQSSDYVSRELAATEATVKQICEQVLAATK